MPNELATILCRPFWLQEEAPVRWLLLLLLYSLSVLCSVLDQSSQAPISHMNLHQNESQWLVFVRSLEQVTELELHQLPGAEVFWLILLTGLVMESGEGKSEHLHPALWFPHPLEGCKVLSGPAHHPPSAPIARIYDFFGRVQLFCQMLSPLSMQIRAGAMVARQ